MGKEATICASCASYFASSGDDGGYHIHCAAVLLHEMQKRNGLCHFRDDEAEEMAESLSISLDNPTVLLCIALANGVARKIHQARDAIAQTN